jgi:sugar phosphate isomerase/epimerase
MQIAYCTWSMMHTPFEEGLPVIAKIGYTGIELAVTPRFATDLYTLDAAKRQRIAELLDEYQITLAAIAGHTTVCEEDPDKHAANMQRLRDTIDLADELRQEGRTPVVVSLVGGHEDDWGRLKNLVAERVVELGNYAASKDVIYAPEMHSGTSMDLPRKALWLLEQVNHPYVKLNFDISHCEIVGMPTEEACNAMAPHSVFTHVKDQRGLYPNHEFLTPGAGPSDYVRYLKAMDAAGYTGFIGMEVSVMVQRKPGFDPFVDAALGYYALLRAFNESGVPLER